jgi:2',3'-cyclic-nucleotide 2'-phosphodiesterase (5'-nucleotidase family)
VPFISANLDVTNEPGLLALQNAGKLARSVVLNVNGVQVGVVGATTETLPFVSFPRDTIVNSVLAEVQSEVNTLDTAGVKIIILSSHLQGLSSEAALIPQLTKVDIVIGGGGGELLANPSALLIPGDTATGAIAGVTGSGYPRFATDFDGKQVPVVTTRGDYRYVGRLIASFDANGEVIAVDPISDPVRVSGIAPDAVAADPVVQAQVVDPVAAHVASLASQIVGVTQVPLDGRSSEVRAFETNLGNMCADALLYNASVNAALVGAPAPQVALQNGGGIRNNSIFPVGNFSELNTFETLPFANFVAIVPSVPAAQFKEILENAVSRVGLSNNGRFAQISGFRFTWDPAGVPQVLDANNNVTTPGTRIREVVLNDGTVIVRNGGVVAGAPAVNVATLDFLARGGDQYPFRNLPFAIVPVSYQQSLDRFINQWLNGSISALEYRAGGEGRIRRAGSPVRVAGILNRFGHVAGADNRADAALDANADGRIDAADLVAELRNLISSH